MESWDDLMNQYKTNAVNFYLLISCWVMLSPLSIPAHKKSPWISEPSHLLLELLNYLNVMAAVIAPEVGFLGGCYLVLASWTSTGNQTPRLQLPSRLKDNILRLVWSVCSSCPPSSLTAAQTQCSYDIIRAGRRGGLDLKGFLLKRKHLNGRERVGYLFLRKKRRAG